MIIPMVLAIVAAVLYASANHIDKYLISKAVKGVGYRALIIVSTIVAGAVMALIYAIICNFQLAFDWQSILLLLFNSAICTVANIFWFKALERDDTAVVVIMFQLIPVFVLFLSAILLNNQYISPVQLIGSAIVTLAAIAVTYEPGKKKFNKKRLITLALMTFVSFAYAIWFVIERFVNQNHDLTKL